MFRKRSAPPEPTYTYQIYPDNIGDGDHEFDGIQVSFAKPGWQWLIYEHVEGRWARVHSLGDGYPTRDAALVALLKAAKDLTHEEIKEVEYDYTAIE